MNLELIVNKQNLQLKDFQTKHVTFFGDRVEVKRKLSVELLEGR